MLYKGLLSLVCLILSSLYHNVVNSDRTSYSTFCHMVLESYCILYSMTNNCTSHEMTLYTLRGPHEPCKAPKDDELHRAELRKQVAEGQTKLRRELFDTIMALQPERSSEQERMKIHDDLWLIDVIIAI